MKFCYVDESGMGTEPFLVMTGVIVDGQRMHVTKDDWAEILDLASEACGRRVKEFHTREFYAGNGPWRGTNGKDRAEALDGILKWWADRKHQVMFSAVDKAVYGRMRDAGKLPQGCETPWRMTALHIMLALQKEHRRYEKNKGHTVCLFDREPKEEAALAALVAGPPKWLEACYGKKEKESGLDQIIDVPYFGDSEHVLLLQVADLMSYVLRSYAEIRGGHRKERYDSELDRLDRWIDVIERRCLPASTRWPTKGLCPAGQVFVDVAPETLRKLGRG